MVSPHNVLTTGISVAVAPSHQSNELTVERAIQKALGVAGIKESNERAAITALLRDYHFFLLDLGVAMCSIIHETPSIEPLAALREACDDREISTMHWKALGQGSALIAEFQKWLADERERLEQQIDLLNDELLNLAPLAKSSREWGTNAALVQHYNERAALLFESRRALELLVANEDLSQFDSCEMSNADADALLLWQQFVAAKNWNR